MNEHGDDQGRTGLELPYVGTTTLLVAHQIDSAYWHEWTLFGIPGGIQAFVLLNVPLVFVFLYGLNRLSHAPRVGARFGIALSVVGVATFVLHMWFIWLGRPEFRTVTSMAVLGGAFLLALELGRRSALALRG